MANKPNNPSLWSRAKSLAKQKFDVYPSAYANGWAAKWYKGKGGSWRKAQDGMQIPYMKEGGKPEWLIEAQLKAQGYDGNALQQKLNSMAYGGGFPMMQAGGNFEANGEMALGQMAAVQDKMNKLRQFINPDDNLDPWIASKLAVMDHSADAISDYLMYGAEGDEELEETDEMEEPEEMKEGGGIPPRYKNMGFTRVGAKRQSTRPGKKWMVLAKKGSQYKVVHGGYKGMKDFSQHHSKKRQSNFWNRMGGKSSSKATDPFSPLYWHKRFGTWKEGGETYDMNQMQAGGMMFREVDGGDISIPNLTTMEMGGYFPRFMKEGGLPKYQTEGWVKRAADANLNFLEKCGLAQSAGGSGVSGGGNMGFTDLQKQAWKERTNPYEGLKGEEKRAKKAAYETALAENPGLTPEMYGMADWDAWSYNSGLKSYGNTIDPTTGMVPESATVPSQFKYFINNKLIQNSGKPATYKDMLNIYNQLEGGFEGGYKPLFMSGYSQKKKNGGTNNPGFKSLPKYVQNKILSRMGDGGYTGTFSGNAYYQQGGMQQQPQQGGGDQQQQIMQIIQAYAQVAQIDPKQIIQKLQTLPPEQQQKAVQQMVQAVQQASSQGGGQEEMQQQPMMRMGGGAPCYKCGGSYQYGGMTDEMGGVVLPAMPSDVYGLPSYGGGGNQYGYMDPAWMKAGGIHINPANKGKFTASAKRAGMGVQEFARKVLANKEDYSSTQVKRANFARNAANWKKQEGGSMNMDQVYDLSNEEIQDLINKGYEIQYV